MTLYTDICDAATSADMMLRKQIATACMKAAIDIFAESPETPNHENRLNWARLVKRSNSAPLEMAGRMTWDVLAADETIRTNPANATDTAVQAVVDALVNDFANGG